jgi:hypothetical protein
VDGYLRIVWASANQDTETLMSQSHKMGFLTGEENEIMLNAHKMSGFTVGEPFALMKNMTLQTQVLQEEYQSMDRIFYNTV